MCTRHRSCGARSQGFSRKRALRLLSLRLSILIRIIIFSRFPPTSPRHSHPQFSASGRVKKHLQQPFRRRFICHVARAVCVIRVDRRILLHNVVFLVKDVVPFAVRETNCAEDLDCIIDTGNCDRLRWSNEI